MLNLPVFLALVVERLADVPVALYFHENQLTYPLQPGEKRDLHYGFINFVSALRADIFSLIQPIIWRHSLTNCLDC